MMKVDIVSPDASIFSGEADELILPGTQGSFGVLKDHAPMITTLQKGIVKLKIAENKIESIQINGGVVEILNNKVIILAE
jgi:F-type H+-transporting ATPase subunit epsilon